MKLDVRDALLSVLGQQTTDMLLARRPDLAEHVAVALGEARLRSGMTLTPLAVFAWHRLVEADMADRDYIPCAIPGYDLDQETARIRDLARSLAARAS